MLLVQVEHLVITVEHTIHVEPSKYEFAGQPVHEALFDPSEHKLQYDVFVHYKQSVIAALQRRHVLPLK